MPRISTEKNEDNFKCSMDIKDQEGKIIGAVCVLKGKHLGNDILFISKDDNAFSVRSITELINKLSRENISYEEKKRILDFISERLLYLEIRKKKILPTQRRQ